MALFPLYPPLNPPVRGWKLLRHTSLLTKNTFCESLDNSQKPSTFQEVDCLLTLINVNNQVAAITLLNEHQLGSWGKTTFVSKIGI